MVCLRCGRIAGDNRLGGEETSSVGPPLPNQASLGHTGRFDKKSTTSPWRVAVAVRIRMKKMGRAHRPFYRICAMDKRTPRDGKVLEELGTYDPMVTDTDARVRLNNERVDYWIGVGAQPSEKVAILIKKYGTNGTHSEVHQAAIEKMALPQVVAAAGEPVVKQKSAEEIAAEEAAAAAEIEAKATAEAEAKAAAEAPAEEASSEKAPAEEKPEEKKEEKTKEAAAE